MTDQIESERSSTANAEDHLSGLLVDLPAEAVTALAGNLADWAEAMAGIVDETSKALELRAAALDGLDEWPRQRVAWAEITSRSLEQLGNLLLLTGRYEALLARSDVLTGAELNHRLEKEGA